MEESVMSKYSVKDKVWFIVADSSPLGGGRHKGVIDAVVADMFDGSILYIVKTTSGFVVPVREDALDHRGRRKR